MSSSNRAVDRCARARTGGAALEQCSRAVARGAAPYARALATKRVPLIRFLYEVIAHTLEEEVRALRGELHRRRGLPTDQFPPEGGAFEARDRPQEFNPDGG